MLQFLGIFNVVLLPIGVLGTIYTFYLYIKGNKGWWKSDFGKLLLTMSGAVGLIYSYSVLVRLWPTLPGRIYWTTLLNIVTVGVIIWRVLILSKVRSVVKRNNEKRDSDARLLKETEPDA